MLGRLRRPTNKKQTTTDVDATVIDEDDDSETEEAEGERVAIGFSTIEQYVSAIIQLFNDQCSLNLNIQNNHPRIPDVKALLRNERRLDTKRRKNNHEDRAAGSILDGYSTTKELSDIIDYFLTKDRHEHYRNAVMMLISHFALMRGDNVRKIELADIQYIPLQGEGPTPEIECPCLVILLKSRKNQSVWQT